jgi:hypothetical protein
MSTERCINDTDKSKYLKMVTFPLRQPQIPRGLVWY